MGPFPAAAGQTLAFSGYSSAGQTIAFGRDGLGRGFSRQGRGFGGYGGYGFGYFDGYGGFGTGCGGCQAAIGGRESSGAPTLPAAAGIREAPVGAPALYVVEPRRRGSAARSGRRVSSGMAIRESTSTNTAVSSGPRIIRLDDARS